MFPERTQLDGHICMGSGSSLRPRKEDPGTPPASLSRAQMEGCALANPMLRLCLDMTAVVSVPQTHRSLICSSEHDSAS